MPPADAGPIDLSSWFASKTPPAPLELEIGSGKGTFLVQQATKMPHVNYIGIEYARPFWRYASDRCRRRRLQNVKIVRAEACWFVDHYVPDSCLSQVHVYFPDPWPKKRHRKRRLIEYGFLCLLHRKLKPEGLVRITTDHSEYFQSIVHAADRISHLFDPLPFLSTESAQHDELVGTNFERKYRCEGRPLHATILRGRAS